jgi:Domain of unknown function (DUF4145)
MANIRNIAYCPHCNNSAYQNLIHVQKSNEDYSPPGVKELTPPWFSYVASCDTCGGVLIYIDEEGVCGRNNFTKARLAWPTERALDNAVPIGIRQVYAEAARIESLSPNAFAGQIRRALEIVCKDRGASSRTLNESLKILVSKNELPSTLAKYTDFLRQLGNAGVHGGEEQVESYQTPTIDEFFRAVVEYIYVAPSKLEDFKEKIDYFRKRKKAAQGKI